MLIKLSVCTRYFQEEKHWMQFMAHIVFCLWLTVMISSHIPKVEFVLAQIITLSQNLHPTCIIHYLLFVILLFHNNHLLNQEAVAYHVSLATRHATQIVNSWSQQCSDNDVFRLLVEFFMNNEFTGRKWDKFMNDLVNEKGAKIT